MVIKLCLLLDLLAVSIIDESKNQAHANDNKADRRATGQTCHHSFLPVVLKVSSSAELDCGYLEGRKAVLDAALM